MSNSISKYESYKDSGVDWLGEVPSHWKLTRLKHVCKVNPKPTTHKKEAVVFLPMEAVSSTGELDQTRVHIRGELPSGLTDFRKGDVLVAKITPCFENGKGAHTDCLNTEYGCGSTEFHVLRAKLHDASPRYIWYLMQCRDFRKYAEIFMEGSAGQKRITTEFISNLYIALPERNEQDRIAIFLDELANEFNTAIFNKRRMIGFLQEQKDILVNQVVTRGLKADAPMKDSGIEWIKKIPSHWAVKRAKYLFSEIDDRSEHGLEELLSVSHLTGVTPRSEKNVSMFMAEDYANSKLCQKSDLIFNTMWAWMGALGVSDRTGIVSPSYAIYRQIKPKVFNDWYLENLLRGSDYIAEYNRRSTGLHSSRLRLYPDMFLDMEIAFPSIDEQNAIEKHAKDLIQQLDNIIDIFSKEVQKLEEFFSITISACITGKIKIRDS